MHQKDEAIYIEDNMSFVFTYGIQDVLKYGIGLETHYYTEVEEVLNSVLRDGEVIGEYTALREAFQMLQMG